MSSRSLEALRAVMMGRTVESETPTQRPTPRFNTSPSAAKMIGDLRVALVAERKARLAAEARLRRVLSEIGRQTEAQPTRAAPPPPMIMDPQLGSAAEEVIEVEGEIVDDVHNEYGSTRDAIMSLGGDEDESEDD